MIKCPKCNTELITKTETPDFYTTSTVKTFGYCCKCSFSTIIMESEVVKNILNDSLFFNDIENNPINSNGEEDMTIEIIEHELFTNKNNRIYSIGLTRISNKECIKKQSLFSINREDGLALCSVIKLSHLRVNDFTEFVMLDISNMDIKPTDDNIEILKKYIKYHFKEKFDILGINPLDLKINVSKVEIKNTPLLEFNI